jgi:hypothetical protein
MDWLRNKAGPDTQHIPSPFHSVPIPAHSPSPHPPL